MQLFQAKKGHSLKQLKNSKLMPTIIFSGLFGRGDQFKPLITTISKQRAYALSHLTLKLSANFNFVTEKKNKKKMHQPVYKGLLFDNACSFYLYPLMEFICF